MGRVVEKDNVSVSIFIHELGKKLMRSHDIQYKDVM